MQVRPIARSLEGEGAVLCATTARLSWFENGCWDVRYSYKHARGRLWLSRQPRKPSAVGYIACCHVLLASQLGCLFARRLGTVYARLILLSCPGRALGDATLRCVVWSASLVVTTHGTPAARHQFVRSVISASSSGAVWGCHEPAPPRPRSSLDRPSLIPSGPSRHASNLASRAISASRLYCTPC